MHIKSLQLLNFRRFEAATFLFGSGFNLLVGENGAGKTTLLRAQVGMLDEFGRVLTEAMEAVSFPTLADVRNQYKVIKGRPRTDPTFPCTISAEFDVEGLRQEVLVYGRFPGGTIGSGSQRMRSFWTSYAKKFNGENTMAVTIFYTVRRVFPRERAIIELNEVLKKKISRLDAYFQWHNAAANVDDLELWVFLLVFGRLQKQVNQYDLEYDDELTVLNNALKICVENCKGLTFWVQELSFMVEWHDRNPTPFDTLSDGQRGLIAMIADIARRACLLNPHLGDKVLEETPGIVLIDELDLHLHPKWQRSIVKNLKQTFPKIQFIATTHSPQIIGECKTDDFDRVIRVTETGGELVYSAFGKDSSQVLKTVMGAEDRDPAIARLLDTLFSQIDEHRFDDARQSLTDLRNASASHLYEFGEAEFALRQMEAIADEAAE